MKLAQVLRIGFIVLAIPGATTAQVAGGLSLSAATESALKSHPLVKASRLEVDQAQNRDAEARAARIPRISVSETITRGNNPVFVFGSLLEQARFGPENFDLSALNNPASLTNFRSSISASVSVFDIAKAARIDQTGIQKEVVLAESQAVEQRVRFEVLQKYLRLVLAENVVDVYRAALRAAESDVARARDRVDAGVAVESDLLAAQVQLAEFKQQSIQAEGQRATALVALNVAIGAPSQTPRVLMLQLNQRAFDVPSPDELFARALRNRIDYRQSDWAIEIADRRITEQRSTYLPQIHVFASAGASGRNPAQGSGDYAIGAGVTLDLFDRTRPAKVAQSRVDKLLAETQRDRLKDQIRVEVVDAYHRYRAAEQQIEVAQSSLSQGIEALRIIQNRYDAGLTTITEVLRAETAVNRARLNVAASTHGQYLGYAHVLLALGEFMDVKEFER